MRISRVLMLVGFVALLAGCGSGIELNNDYDQQLDFSQFKTFEWVPSKGSGGGSQISGLIEERIKNAVVDQLTKKGMTQATGDPDVYVAYHVGTQDKVDVTDYGYSYGGYGRYGGAYGGPYGAGGGGISTYNYTEGTLIVDIYDASNKQLAWRGSGKDVLADNPSPDQLTDNINKAVAAIMSQYPPKK
jgi:hypothetical protein